MLVHSPQPSVTTRHEELKPEALVQGPVEREAVRVGSDNA